MRSSFAYIVLVLAAVASSAPVSDSSRIVLRQDANGGDAQSGASSPANGGSVTNSGAGAVVNAFGSGNAGDGGESATGDAEGGNGGNGENGGFFGFLFNSEGGSGASVQSGNSGPANGGNVVNSGSNVWNAFGSGNAGNGGTSSTGSSQGGSGGNGEWGLFKWGVRALSGLAQSGDAGPANGGFVRNSGDSVFNIGGSGKLGNGGISMSGNVGGGAGGSD